jgi:hypothetical protein
VTLEVLVNLSRQLMLNIIREKAHEVAAPAIGRGHNGNPQAFDVSLS